MLRNLMSALIFRVNLATTALIRTRASSFAKGMRSPAGWALILLFPIADAEDVGERAAVSTLREVEVRGKRLRLDQLRQEMARLEERIYERYNEVNTIEKFDVMCSDYTRTGTRLQNRYCRPKFVEDARVDEGRIAFQARQLILSSQSMAGGVQLPESMEPKVQAQMPAYQENFRKIAEQDPLIRALMRERAGVSDQMRRTHSETFGETFGE